EITSAAITGRKSSLRDGLAQFVQGGSASQALIHAHSLFEEWALRIMSSPLPEFIRNALHDTRWHETIADEQRRDQILANVEKVIDIVRDTLEGTGAGIHDTIKALEPPEVDREREGEVVIESGAVQIMTIHAAKGLEFGIVILAGLGSGGGNASTILTDQLGLTFGLPAKVASLDDPTKLVRVSPVLSHDMNKV
ncbi:MAG: hypothetical protein NTX15_06720, partial [Candidatus Kapabacteria bacterium]|nr:hypothetical protein [Candidatus Kapabacteria bacterium]